MTRRPATESGDVMLTTVVFLVALLTASTILVSASEQWEARRKAAAAAGTLARAGAQGDTGLLRRGDDRIDPVRASERAASVLNVLDNADPDTAYEGALVSIDGPFVTAEVRVSVDYTFPVPGFPDQILGSATAEAVRGSDR